MKKGFSKLDPPGHEGETNTWLTPLNLVRSLGPFDLDPCGYPCYPTAENLITLPDDDGLKQKWYGRVWLNPPYGREMHKWIKKLEAHGNGLALIFARTDTALFHSIKPSALFFLKGRLKFLTPDLKEKSNAGHGSMLIAYGENNVNAIKMSGLSGRFFYEREQLKTKGEIK